VNLSNFRRAGGADGSPACRWHAAPVAEHFLTDGGTTSHACLIPSFNLCPAILRVLAPSAGRVTKRFYMTRE